VIARFRQLDESKAIVAVLEAKQNVAVCVKNLQKIAGRGVPEILRIVIPEEAIAELRSRKRGWDVCSLHGASEMHAFASLFTCMCLLELQCAAGGVSNLSATCSQQCKKSFFKNFLPCFNL
jgi:hypothetical protein